MKTLSFCLFTAAAISFSACKTSSVPDAAHNSRNSLDWQGIYIMSTTVDGKTEKTTVITLENDLTYRFQAAVAGESDKATDITGSFVWNKSGSEITLKGDGGNNVIYIVGENSLSEKGSNSVLTKLEKESITEKYWKLVELNGKPVVKDDNFGREAHLILKAENNKFNGSAGCNTFFGSYQLNEASLQIKFSQVASTRMACPDMETENQFINVLNTVDNYTISADGTKLSLNKARMAPLARFEVVYLK